ADRRRVFLRAGSDGRALTLSFCLPGQKSFKPSCDRSKMVSRGLWPWRAGPSGRHIEGDSSPGCRTRTPRPAIRLGSEDDPMAIPVRVLIVADSPDHAALVVRELERGGYFVVWRRVDRAFRMEAALQDERWDLVIADDELPGFDAGDSLAILRRYGDQPFIVVSGGIGEDLAAQRMRAGAN